MPIYDAASVIYDDSTTEYDEGDPSGSPPPKTIEFLTTANAEYIGLQSGNAPRPFMYIEAIVSASTSIVGCSYASNNWLMDGGTIDREKPVFPGDRSNIFSSDVTLKVDNANRRWSPDYTGSVFNDNIYLDSPMNYWAGFINTSGTALLLQRGSWLLDNIRIDSRRNLVYMRLKDKFKRALDTEIGVDASGTAIDFVTTGQLRTDEIVSSLLITGAGLTAGDLSLQTSIHSFDNKAFSQQSIANALSLLCEASDGFMFPNRQGLLEYAENTPIFGTASDADFTARGTDFVKNVFWEQSRDDLVGEVIVNFSSGSAVTRAGNDLTAKTINIDNSIIESTADGFALASRTLDRFSGQVTKVDLETVWIPTLDVGDKIDIDSQNVALTGNVFEVYRIQEQPTKGVMRLSLISDRVTGKFGFWSHATGLATATEPHSAVFAGSGTTESGGWQAGWFFWARDSATGTNPEFDADGDNDNVVEEGVTSSGVGGTGIELGFQWY